MAEYGLRKQIGTLLRFFRFAWPHWKLIVVALLAVTLLSLARGGVVLLVGPLWRGLEGLEAAEEQPGLQADEGEAAPEAGLSNPLERLSKEFGNMVSQLSSIRKLRDYVGPGPQQFKHIAYLVLLVVGPIWVVAVFLEEYASGRLLWGVMAGIRVAIFERLSRMPLSFFGRVRAGELVSRITNDVNMTQNAVQMLLTDVFRHPIVLAALLAASIWKSWQLTAVFLVALPLFTLALRYYGGRIQGYGRKSLEKLSDVTEAVTQMLSGIRVVKAFSMEGEENAEFRERNRQQLRRAFKLVRNKAFANAVPQLIIVICLGIILLLGSYLWSRRAVSVENLLAVGVAVSMMISPTKHMMKCYSAMRADMAAMDRILELLDMETQTPDAADACDIGEVREGVRFNRVWFAYEDNQYVLRDIDLYVPRDTVCAVVGEMGAGKSTMLDLIPRFYDVLRGSVEIDGLDVRRATRQSLMRQIAVVGQQPFLFNRSIRENIRYGRRDATDEEVVAAAKAANIHEFISTLPEGYDTLVGERGGRLSGGQRQCVTIARALLKDAPILILDEATSNLDSESEHMVQQALCNLMKGRTTFVIAHRLSTVRFADMIVVLKAGAIVELGTHEELLARGGEYKKLYRLQLPA